MPASASLLNRAEGIVADNPVGRAAVLLTHPLRAWAVERAMTHGSVSVHDLGREFPAVAPARLRQHLMHLAGSGWLTPDPQYRLRPGDAQRHFPGDTSALSALHAYLTTLLSPAQEAQK